MTTREINFDGLIGPTHNFAGQSLGNVASASSAGGVARPRAAALQGLAKMRRLMDLGIPQGFLPPPRRPATGLLRGLGFAGSESEVLANAAQTDPDLFRVICAASSMWTANAATVIAAADATDGRVHLVTTNLATMAHRSIEAEETFRRLQAVFGDSRYFAVHPALPLGVHFGDEGAANHMRLAAGHGTPGLNIFVHGAPRGGPFPERQVLRASQSVARLGQLPADRAVFALQAADAIQAGAFHNDVVAVANETVLLAHPEAFDDKAALFAAVMARVPQSQIVEVGGVSLDEAISTYLFNAQLVTLPRGGMALILPTEVRENARVWAALNRSLAACAQIERVETVDVHESMRNGGGPACLRLRVPVSAGAAAAIHSGYLLTPDRWDRLAAMVEALWPETVAPSDLTDPALWAHSHRVDAALQAFIEGV